MGESKGSDFRTDELPIWIEARAGAITLALHVQPGARRTDVIGVHGNRLKIAVSSPPTDGRANAALLEYLASRLQVARSSLELAAGAGSREKRVAVHSSLTPGEVAAALLPAR